MKEPPKASKALLDLLNESVSRELQVSIQYMWQHVLWSGVKGMVVKDVFKQTAIAEMKHAEAIAERMNYFRATPTTAPTPIVVGKTLEQMVKQDKKDEAGAIDLYNKVIALARKEGDEVTALLFQQILTEEQDHYDTFATLLEEI